MVGFEYHIISALLCALVLVGVVLLFLKKKNRGAYLTVDEAAEKAAKYIDSVGTIDLDRLMAEEYGYQVDRHNGGLVSWTGKHRIWLHFRGDDTVRRVGYSDHYRWMVWESFGESEQYLTYIQYQCTPYRRVRKISMSALAATMSAAEERVREFRYI